MLKHSFRNAARTTLEWRWQPEADGPMKSRSLLGLKEVNVGAVKDERHGRSGHIVQQKALDQRHTTNPMCFDLLLPEKTEPHLR